MRREVRQAYAEHLQGVLARLENRLKTHERHCSNKDCSVHRPLMIHIERVKKRIEEVKNGKRT